MSYTILSNRLLRYDGKSVVEPSEIGDLLLSGVSPDNIISTEISEDIKLFNTMSDIPIVLYNQEDESYNLDFTWGIPQEFLDIDLIDYFSKFITPENELRIIAELEMVLKLDIQEEFKTIIYVVHKLKEDKVLWGVGRGSSCSSYLLFLIGIHCVDCIKYDIPMTEFFK